MPASLPYTDDEVVIELEPDATDSNMTATIATLVALHLHGSTPEQAHEFLVHSMLPLVAGLLVSSLGVDAACAAFASMPNWTRAIAGFESGRPAGPAH